MKYLIKFSKEGYIKYISHLDMIRLFKRAFKKSGLHLEHSQGFNPHPKMTFAQPLSLGYTSEGELLEIDTKADFKPSEIVKMLGDVMPEGITIVNCKRLNEKTKGVAGKITEAKYEISILDNNISNENIDEFLKQDQIIAYKKQKKKKELKEVNIKPMIRDLQFNIDCDKIIMTTIIDCGSTSNLNPDLIIQALSSFLGYEIPAENVEIKRIYLK